MAGANEYTIKIVVQADGTAAVKGFTQVQDSMDKTTKTSGGLGSTLSMLGNKWLGLGVGINQAIELFQKATFIPRKIIEIGEAGAQLVRAETAFNAVTASVGKFGPAVAASLEEAAGGYMDASDIMEKSGRLISQGMPTENLVDLMGVLKEMAPLVGDTLPAAWDKAMESFSRGTLRQMKAYVGYVNIDKALSEWAEKHDVFAAGLSDETRLLAIAEIATDRMKNKLRGLSGAVDEHVDSMTKARVQISESWERIEKAMVPPAAKLLEWTSKVVERLSRVGLAMDAVRKDAEKQKKIIELGGVIPSHGKGFEPAPKAGAKEKPPLLREMTAEERKAIIDKTIAAEDSWNTRMKILDREMETYRKTYTMDKEDKEAVEKYKAAITKQWQKEQTQIMLGEQEKRMAATGDEIGALRTRFQMEVMAAKGNETIIASIREREKMAILKYHDDVAASYIRMHGEQLKEESAFQQQVVALRAQAGLISEEESIRARLAGKQEELAIEIDISRQVLSLTHEPEKRRQLTQQIQALENRMIGERMVGEVELATYRYTQAREITRIEREGATELLSTRMQQAESLRAYQVKVGGMTEGESIAKRYAGEQQILQQRIANLQILIGETRDREKQADLIERQKALQQDYNLTTEKQTLDLENLRYEKGKQILEIIKEQDTAQQEGLNQSMDRINALLDLTASSHDQLLQTLALGMKSVTSGGAGVMAAFGETDPLGERYKRQLEIYKKMEESTRDHEDRQRIMAEQSKALQTAFEEKEWGKRVAMASGAFGSMAGLALSFYAISGKQSKEALALYQTMAVAQAIMDTYASALLAYKRGLEVPYIGAYLAPTLAAIAVAAGMARVAAIKAQTFHTGGTVTGTGEEVATVLQKREVVVDRDTADRSGGYKGIMNKLGETSGTPPPQDIQVINILDDSIVDRWAMSPRGRRVIKNIVGITK